jgi:ketosteroid isomerase-like protein
MMIVRPVLAAISVTALLAFMGCTQQQNEEGDLEGFKKGVAAFYTAIEEDDHAGRAEMFTDSAFMLPNHWTYTQGKEPITKMITGSEGWVFKLKDVKHLDMGVSGDLGYTINEYFYTWHAEGSEPEWHKTKNIHIWKRQPDGTWKLHADIWNSSEPLPLPEAEE